MQGPEGDWRPPAQTWPQPSAPPSYYSGQPLAPPQAWPQAWPTDWPDPGLPDGDGATAPVHAELLPAPAAGILMRFLAAGSVIFALAGPAGIIAGTIALVARRRLLRIEADRLGHRSVRDARWAHRFAWTAIFAGTIVTGVIIATAAGLLVGVA